MQSLDAIPPYHVEVVLVVPKAAVVVDDEARKYSAVGNHLPKRAQLVVGEEHMRSLVVESFEIRVGIFRLERLRIPDLRDLR